MLGFEKDRYVKVEFSCFELQMLWAIVDWELQTTQDYSNYFFTKINLQDLEKLLSDEICKM
jgi:hypothetical protein